MVGGYEQDVVFAKTIDFHLRQISPKHEDILVEGKPASTELASKKCAILRCSGQDGQTPCARCGRRQKRCQKNDMAVRTHVGVGKTQSLSGKRPQGKIKEAWRDVY